MELATRLHASVRSPWMWGALALGCFGGVWWYKMTPSTSNLTVVAGIIFAAPMMWCFPWVSSQPPTIRFLFVILTVTLIVIAQFYLGFWSETQAPPTPMASVRIKYSSRQTLQLSPTAVPSEQVLNLDNTALLRLHVPYNLHSVTLALLKDAPLTIAEPQAGKTYEHSGGIMTFSIGKGIQNFATYAIASTYEFTTRNPVQIIRVKDRAFQVKLDEINERSSKDIPRTDYVFAISEE